MELIFWQNMPSPHQLPYLSYLNELVPIKLICQEYLPNYRKQMGWDLSLQAPFDIIVNPDRKVIINLIKQNDAIHIVSGIRGCELIKDFWQQNKNTNIKLAIMGEPLDPRGFKGYLRKLYYRYKYFFIKDKIDFVLAMGKMGCYCYSGRGIPEEKIFPFCYVTETPDSESIKIHTNNTTDERINITFIGSLIHRKRVDLLVEAFAKFARKSDFVTLNIIGDGPERANLENQIERLAIKSKTCFHGFMENAKAMDLLNQSNLLVLPSQFDGWGAVVNEALMRGTPVICSDMCGAKDLIVSSLQGQVFKAGSVSSLYNAMENHFDEWSNFEVNSSNLKIWSKCISGKNIAYYLYSILESVYRDKLTPDIPWRHI